MSNLHAIATITAALRTRLAEIVPEAAGGATATAMRPGDAGGLPGTGVNVFLYAAKTNGVHRNADLPTRHPDGTIRNRPAVALDLDYLLTFYGEDLVTSHRVMGSALRSLHARPTLTKAMIEAVETAPGGMLSRLAEQNDPVRILPLDLTIEEMSKLWSVLLQAKYVLSAAFRLGPVLIEAELDPVPGKPVRGFTVSGIPLQPPLIARVEAAGGSDAAIIPGAKIAILGSFDAAAKVAVSISGAEVTPTLARAHRIEATLPAGAPVGAAAVTVRHDLLLGLPPTPHRGIASEPFAIIIRPQIAARAGAPDIRIDQVSGTGAELRSARIAVRLTASIAAGRQAALLLIAPATEETRVFRADEAAGATDTLAFSVTGLPAGRYVVQLAIDGATSPIIRNRDPGSPDHGQPSAPEVILP